jgi:hypothetical protein
MAALITPPCVDIKSPKAFGPVATAPLKLASGQLSESMYAHRKQHLSSRGLILSSSQPDQLLRKTLLLIAASQRVQIFALIKQAGTAVLPHYYYRASIICIQK